jgi:hypothetical protein
MNQKLKPVDYDANKYYRSLNKKERIEYLRGIQNQFPIEHREYAMIGLQIKEIQKNME